MTFFFQPANITSQIVNFGIPAPIDLQIIGRDAEANYKIARRLAERISLHTGCSRRPCPSGGRSAGIGVKRRSHEGLATRLTQRDVTNSMLISLTGNGRVAPNFWLNWSNGVNYNVGVQTPQYRVNSLDALLRTPISTSSAGAENRTTTDSQAGAASATNAFCRRRLPTVPPRHMGIPAPLPERTQLLSNLVSVQRAIRPVIVNHYNVWPVYDVYANVDRRDLGGVGRDVERIMRDEEPHLRVGTTFQFARTDRNDAIFFLPAWARNDFRGGAGLSIDDGEFSVLGRSVHHSDGAAWCDGWNIMDVVRYRHNSQRPIAHGLHHVYRRCHREQHSNCDLRQRRTRYR